MDDLYGNLENYDEVNALEELKTENRELKAKLGDYAATMDKLQKDFDKLASEFKTLEFNYSSLLKTARAEIERKTQMITNINLEKDMLILNSLQNGNINILRGNMTNKPLPIRKDWKENEPDSNHWKKHTKELKDNRNLKNTETLNGRTKESQTPSENLIASFSANYSNTLTNIVNKGISNVDSCSDGNSESKENLHHPVKQLTEDTKPLSIKNRRKSMPAANVIYEKFSSDEDFDSPARELSKYNFIKDKYSKKNLDKTYNNNNGTKMSESSSMDDRTSGYHESSRETFRSRNNRYIENDNFRNREKYDTSFRRKRHCSPDRSYQRPPREYLEDRYQRPSFGRGRDMRIPPPDRFQHIQRKSRDQHLNYERNKPCPKERYTHRQDRLKHNISNDYDEPYGKRQKTDLYSRHREEDARWYNNREDEGKEPVEETLDHLQALQSQYTSCTSPDNLQYTSCLSPDYVNTDIVLEPKEIMDTAVTQLEDPRVISKKYVMKTDDVKVTLSTVIGRNVDMKLFDKTVWGIKEVAVPEALVQPPIEDKLIQEIYMDIDNPILNVSVEASDQIGEIKFDTEYIPSAKNKADDVKCMSEISSKIKSYVNEPHSMSKFKNPKDKQCDRDAQQSIVHDNPVKSLGLIEDFHTTSDDKNSFNGKSKTDKDEPSKNVIQKHDNFISKNEGGVENKIHNWLHINEHQNSSHISASEIVEGDLELSDETCDHMELHNQDFNYHIENKTYQKQKRSEVALYSGSVSHENRIVENDNDKTPKITVEAKNNNASNSNNEHFEVENILAKETSEHNIQDIKKLNGKRQKQKDAKFKDINMKINEPSDCTDKILTKDKKTKKKEKPKQIKTKFRDLFGDSSSLITPEDLGLATISTPNEIRPPTNYLPIFEDAVDAINIKHIAKVTSQASANVNQDAIPSHKTDKKEVIETNKSTKTSKESRKKKSKKAEDPKTVPKELVPTVKTMNENLNIEAVTKETDVVKTVVISTGIQPQLTLGNNIEINNKTHEVAEVSADHKQNEPINKETLIKALAASTPHKDLCQNIQLVPDLRIPESSCTSNDSPVTSIDNVPSAANLSGTLDSQPETDVPDVRIFVRRRKKVIKRPPMT